MNFIPLLHFLNFQWERLHSKSGFLSHHNKQGSNKVSKTLLNTVYRHDNMSLNFLLVSIQQLPFQVEQHPDWTDRDRFLQLSPVNPGACQSSGTISQHSYCIWSPREMEGCWIQGKFWSELEAPGSVIWDRKDETPSSRLPPTVEIPTVLLSTIVWQIWCTQLPA